MKKYGQIQPCDNCRLNRPYHAKGLCQACYSAKRYSTVKGKKNAARAMKRYLAKKKNLK